MALISHSKIVNSSKWSFFTEIVAKIISLVTTMILARLLATEVFGIVASITMVISFIEIFTDAGFQKYLIEYKFSTENNLNKSVNLGFPKLYYYNE